MSGSRGGEKVREGMGAIVHDGGVAFRVWAPHAEAVFVTGSFNAWAEDAAQMALEDEEAGIWYLDLAGAAAGDEYRFLLRTADETLSRIDPYARAVTASNGNGIVIAPEPCDAFTPPAWNRMVIYEMHVGTFSRTEDVGGTFEGAVDRFGHLKRLGVNAIQIMPSAEFAGDISWGYNPAHIFAVESTYGGPEGLRAFIAAAHAAGIAVILDVVYNHFGPSDLDLWRFDGWSENDRGGIYFYNDWKAETPWGATRPDYGRGEVRQFIRDNALYWLGEYGLDGLRFDMTLYIRNAKGDEGDPGDSLEEGWSLMRWINEEVSSRFPGRITIAEDLRNKGSLTADPDDGGAGFGAQWCAEFVHPVREVLIAQDDAQRRMGTLAHAIMHHYNGDPFERVIYSESHDEVANGKARIPEEIAPGDPTHWAAQKRATLGAALLFTTPGIPMIFQGQEFLQGEWFQDHIPMDWDQRAEFRGVVRLWRDLIRLRLDHAGVTGGLAGRGVQVHRVDEEKKLIAYHRWDSGGQGDDVVVVANFSADARGVYRIGFPRPGRWVLRLNTDWTGYSEDFADTDSFDVEAAEAECDGMAWSAEVAVGPYAALVYSQDP